ncbi:rhomboid family intramembrane serine protease [Candidatus Spongiisocius sp.]|uniref:rhomboid family intramembrane serine protease n=1 Tax=Candidatus Spongiisocius sp. TaxID=3101273 RepID=UPI003B5C9C04
MIPIRDLNPGIRRPIVSLLLIASVVAVYFLVQPADPADEYEFLVRQAAIGCEISTNEAVSLEEIRSERCVSGDGGAVFPEKSLPLSVVVSIFLHGGLAHLLGNVWSLWLFGNNVEDAYGRAGYLLLYLISGAVATFGFVALNPDSTAPLVGASGAIAGVMGAYFVLFPGARVLSIIPPIFIPFRMPAALFLLLWLGAQFLLAGGASGIAWEAHVAGFLFGMVVTLVFRRGLTARLTDLKLRSADPAGYS